MTQETILSGEEIAALMSREDRASDRDGRRRRAQPRSFSFGNGSAPPSVALPALDRMNERLAKRIRDVIEPFVRGKPRVDAEPAITRTLGDWQAEQSDFAGLSLYSIKPLKGVLAIAVPSEFVSRLVDAFYGGNGAAPLAQAKEFTRTEESMLARLSDALAVTMAEVWREVSPIEPQLRGRETNVALARICSPEEAVLVCRFTVAPPQGKPAQIDILIPAAALRSVEGALVAKSEDGCARGAEWRAQLGAALGDVRIEARTVLARPELSVAEIVQLKVGDVIPVSIPASVPLLVEGRTVAVGSIGEQDGKAALKIERIENRRNAA
jgi:flagellar motor switch protein FliM